MTPEQAVIAEVCATAYPTRLQLCYWVPTSLSWNIYMHTNTQTSGSYYLTLILILIITASNQEPQITDLHDVFTCFSIFKIWCATDVLKYTHQKPEDMTWPLVIVWIFIDFMHAFLCVSMNTVTVHSVIGHLRVLHSVTVLNSSPQVKTPKTETLESASSPR